MGHEDLLWKIYVAANDAIFVVDPKEECIVEANSKASEMLEYSREEFRGLPVGKVHSDGLEVTTQFWKTILPGKVERPYKLSCTTKTGGVVPVEISASVIEVQSHQYILAIVRDISKRNRLEKALKESQTRLKLLSSISTHITTGMSVEDVIKRTVNEISKYFRNLRVAYSTLDNQGKIKVIYSKQPKEMPEISGLEGDLSKAPLYLRALKRKEPVIVENVFKDIQTAPLRDSLSAGKTMALLDMPLKHSDMLMGLLSFGSPDPLIWSNHEITTLKEAAEYLSIVIRDAETQEKRRRAEEAQRESEKRYQTLAEVLPVGIFHADAEGNCTYVNERWCRIAGISFKEALGEGWLRAVHSEDREQVAYEWYRSAQTHTPFKLEFRFLNRKNIATWVFGQAVAERNKSGEVVGYVGTITDITERMRIEAALQESEEKYRMVVQNSKEAIFIIQRNEIRFFNSRAIELSGYPENELTSKKFYKLFHPEDRKVLKEQLNSHQDNKKFSKFNSLRILDKLSDLKWVELNSVQIKWRGEPAYLCCLNDITEQRRLQEELARVQRVETAGRVAGQIAHDFNNLLSPLSAYPILIREELPEDHPALEMLDEMEDSANKIAEINQQLLALGRRGHYAMEPVDLNDLAHKILINQQLPKEITIKEHFEPNLFLIKGGAAQLTRALTNLINNAKETMQGSGILTVKTGNTYLDTPLRGYQTIAGGEYVKLSISDTGPGIKPEILDKIFDPFFTTKRMDLSRGSGLGLSVVHGIVEDHKGYIQVETKVRNGTTFSLYFPVTREAEKEVWVTDTKSISGNERILVVDDDPIQRRVASQLLRRFGYRVQAVSSGEKAVSHLRKRRYDLLIMDMVMNGIDGVEAYRQILELEPDQKAIVLSGYAMSNRVQAAIKLGAGAFVTKPVTQQVLVNAVRKELDKGGKKRN